MSRGRDTMFYVTYCTYTCNWKSNSFLAFLQFSIFSLEKCHCIYVVLVYDTLKKSSYMLLSYVVQQKSMQSANQNLITIYMPQSKGPLFAFWSMSRAYVRVVLKNVFLPSNPFKRAWKSCFDPVTFVGSIILLFVYRVHLWKLCPSPSEEIAWYRS